jgi:hypothetical protein
LANSIPPPYSKRTGSGTDEHTEQQFDRHDNLKYPRLSKVATDSHQIRAIFTAAYIYMRDVRDWRLFGVSS